MFGERDSIQLLAIIISIVLATIKITFSADCACHRQAGILPDITQKLRL